MNNYIILFSVLVILSIGIYFVTKKEDKKDDIPVEIIPETILLLKSLDSVTFGDFIQNLYSYSLRTCDFKDEKQTSLTFIFDNYFVDASNSFLIIQDRIEKEENGDNVYVTLPVYIPSISLHSTPMLAVETVKGQRTLNYEDVFTFKNVLCNVVVNYNRKTKYIYFDNIIIKNISDVFCENPESFLVIDYLKENKERFINTLNEKVYFFLHNPRLPLNDKFNFNDEKIRHIYQRIITY